MLQILPVRKHDIIQTFLVQYTKHGSVLWRADKTIDAVSEILLHMYRGSRHRHQIARPDLLKTFEAIKALKGELKVDIPHDIIERFLSIPLPPHWKVIVHLHNLSNSRLLVPQLQFQQDEVAVPPLLIHISAVTSVVDC